jgi:hypothetical protein
MSEIQGTGLINERRVTGQFWKKPRCRVGTPSKITESGKAPETAAGIEFGGEVSAVILADVLRFSGETQSRFDKAQGRSGSSSGTMKSASTPRGGRLA